MKTIRVQQPEPISIEICQDGETLITEDLVTLSLLYTDCVSNSSKNASLVEVYEKFRQELQTRTSTPLRIETIYMVVDAIGQNIEAQKKTSIGSPS